MLLISNIEVKRSLFRRLIWSLDDWVVTWTQENDEISDFWAWRPNKIRIKKCSKFFSNEFDAIAFAASLGQGG